MTIKLKLEHFQDVPIPQSRMPPERILRQLRNMRHDNNERENMLKENEINEVIDSENGEGFYQNIDTQGRYLFAKGDSEQNFILYKIEKIDDFNVLVINYISCKDIDVVSSLLAFLFNFCINYEIHMIYYSQKERIDTEVIKFLDQLKWKKYKKRKRFDYAFDCNLDGEDCHCNSYFYYFAR